MVTLLSLITYLNKNQVVSHNNVQIFSKQCILTL